MNGDNTSEGSAPHATTAGSRPDQRHRAPGLALFGIAALLVAGWGLAGGPELPDVSTIGWIVVAAGLIIGVALILAGAKSSRH